MNYSSQVVSDVNVNLIVQELTLREVLTANEIYRKYIGLISTLSLMISTVNSGVSFRNLTVQVI